MPRAIGLIRTGHGDTEHEEIPMHRYTAALLGAAALIAGASAPAANADVALVAEKSCNLGFMPVKPTVGVGTIIGNAWADCEVPPEAHEMRLSLDHRVGDSWESPKLISNSTIPSPRLVYQVKTPCEPGFWRVSAEECARGQ